ncbi:MAG TPA: hypothetical protein VFK41_09460 [Nocardioidaceae bacterium]|nr:hypothetical protein [Nocardioidaceae bacterium]
MSTPVKVAAFLAALVAAFVAAWGVGNAVDPIATEPAATHDDGHGDSGEESESHLPGGLMVSQDGYTLDAQAQAAAGSDVPISFRITDPEGETLTSYDVEHEKRLHLIAVRRDFTGFQHVHPELHSSGTWLTELDLEPGQWRLFADFKPTGGEGLTLGTDLLVPGRQGPTQPTEDTRTAEVDGYVVELAGDLVGGTASRLTLSVTEDGQPIRTEEYLGASGHLVALREGDLAYLHVHPESVEDLVFVAEVPSAGRYHLYLDFQVGGVVRTAAFVVTAEGADHGH